jgi:hypothetical protein
MQHRWIVGSLGFKKITASFPHSHAVSMIGEPHHPDKRVMLESGLNVIFDRNSETMLTS